AFENEDNWPLKTRISLLTPSLKKYNLIVLALSLAVLSQSTWMAVEAQSRKTLQGSATFYDTEYTGASKHAYYPKDRWLRHTDQLTIGYKLGAAEAEYRKMLRQNPANAGAHNGLGKVTYFLTTSSNELIREKREAMLTQAIQHFHSALRYQPNYVEARVNL